MLSQLLVMKRHGVIKDEDWDAVLALKHHDLLMDEDDDLEEQVSRESPTRPINDHFMQIRLEEMHSKVALSIAGMPVGDKDIKNAVSLQNKVYHPTSPASPAT
jgi:hypothetical protein